jgi:SAM-dependent methyltransferase
MILIQRDPARVFQGFLKRIHGEVYSEPDSEMHQTLIDRMLPEFAKFIPNLETRLLDVGCGQGYACLKFLALGYRRVTAITLSDTDAAVARQRGIDCYRMDMSFPGFEEKTFDALWVRHALEHSPFPYLTVLEFNRILSPAGFVYIEMPSPDSPRELEKWPNHYSILGVRMWEALFDRSGFRTIAHTTLPFTLQIQGINDGLPFTQSNHVFILRKARDEAIP